MYFLPTVLAGIAFLYLMYYRLHYGKKPVLYGKQNGNWVQFLDLNVSSLKKEYWSYYLIPGGKFQTIVAALLPKMSFVTLKREIISTPDGCQFVLAWGNVKDLESTYKPIIVVYPGLASTSNSKYVKELASYIVDDGYGVVVIINRGLETPCLTGKAFCATHTIDLDQTISIVKDRYPKSPIVAIGISLGGLILTRYLSLKGSNSNVEAAFIYSSPFNPVLGSVNLEKWHNWIL